MSEEVNSVDPSGKNKKAPAVWEKILETIGEHS